jgi:hypothetical protein
MLPSMSTLPSPPGSQASSPTEPLPATTDAASRAAPRARLGRHRRRLGRPTILTAELKDEIVARVREVGALATAARCAGVSVRVAREWFARGLGQDPDRPCTPLFADFAHGIEKARGDFVARRIRRIEQAAEGGTWTADAWAVERIDPDTWGRKDRVDVSGTITFTEVRGLLVAMIGVLSRYVPTERRETEFANLLAEARKLGGGSVVSVPVSGAR